MDHSQTQHQTVVIWGDVKIIDNSRNRYAVVTGRAQCLLECYFTFRSPAFPPFLVKNSLFSQMYIKLAVCGTVLKYCYWCGFVSTLVCCVVTLQSELVDLAESIQQKLSYFNELENINTVGCTSFLSAASNLIIECMHFACISLIAP